MQRAADISVLAHRAAMRAARAGIHEFELQAEVERVFRMHDAQPAYCSIVGAGANACVLHYRDNNAKARDGELVLIDAGAEYRNYASDITRTFPGQRPFQQGAARACMTWCARRRRLRWRRPGPGVPYEAGHAAAVETLTDGLLQLGLLKGKLENSDRRQAITSASTGTRPGTGSGWTCTMSANTASKVESRLLEPGMVFTIEPGLYVAPDDASVAAKWRGIGIRIEDDVLVTATGHRVLTDALARSAGQVEALMAG